jgi:flagellar biosynthesis component FlhA
MSSKYLIQEITTINGGIVSAIPNYLTAGAAGTVTRSDGTNWTVDTIHSGDLPAGTGTVTSVALAAPAIFTVSGSPITTSGTLTLTLANQNANAVFAGPASGSAAAPTFRPLVFADLPITPFIGLWLN